MTDTYRHVVAASILASLSALGVGVQAQSRISVDVTIDQVLEDGSGGRRPAAAAALTRFRLERVRTAGGWKTVLTYPATTASREAPDRANPLDGARLEYDDGVDGVRIYDRNGRLDERLSRQAAALKLPARDGARPWLESLIVRPQAGEQRRRELRRVHGTPVRVRNLDRYLTRDGTTEHEVLADPSTGLVVESSTSQAGTITRRETYEYTTLPDGRYARRRIRSEEPLPARSARTVTTITLGDITEEP